MTFEESFAVRLVIGITNKHTNALFQGLKEPKRVPPTVPESPAFTLKHRARIPVVEEPQVNAHVVLVCCFLHYMVDCSI